MLALLAVASFESVAVLPAAAHELGRTLASGRRVLDLIDRDPAVRDPEAPLTPPVEPSVAIEDVTASYGDGDPPVLNGFDLRLEPGRRVALVGPSGSGKTTVTNLLLRFLDPGAGLVTLGKRDLRGYRQEDVRRTFALAGQDAHVFNSTIRANLLLGRPDATEAGLWTALRRARLDAWVDSLPDGLETLVGEDGNRLSGGQRQRLTVARALLSDAPVLVLDEPTAHLDPETARALVDDAFAAAADRSILLITHRQEGLDLVDEVVTLGIC
jgi:ABC-type transport system involved in cytochrome bd biosynthesis fused ATPase/permease subunit